MRKNTLFLACALACSFIVTNASAESIEQRLGLSKGSVVTSSTTVSTGKVVNGQVVADKVTSDKVTDKVTIDGKAEPMVSQPTKVMPLGEAKHSEQIIDNDILMHNCEQFAYRDHNSFTFQFALAGNVRYYQLKSFTKNGKSYGKADADKEGEAKDYFGAFGRLNFSAYYNLYNSTLFKVAVGPDLFINAGALGQKPNIGAGKVRAEDVVKAFPTLINFGASAFFQIKTEYFKPYLKFTASHESYSSLSASSTIYTGTFGVEFKNGFTLYVSGQSANVTGTKLFSEGSVEKKLNGYGAEFGIGTYF